MMKKQKRNNEDNRGVAIYLVVGHTGLSCPSRWVYRPIQQ